MIAEPSAGRLGLLRGRGNGAFDAERAHGAGQDPVAIATADFNGDGQVDLAFASGPSNGPVGSGVTVVLDTGCLK